MKVFCGLGLRLYVSVNNFSVMSGRKTVKGDRHVNQTYQLPKASSDTLPTAISGPASHHVHQSILLHSINKYCVIKRNSYAMTEVDLKLNKIVNSFLSEAFVLKSDHAMRKPRC